MPLSDREQELLKEIERSLYENDPTLSTRLQEPKTTTSVGDSYTKLVVGVLLLVLGIGIMVTGVILKQPVVGVLGFGFMFWGGYYVGNRLITGFQASPPKHNHTPTYFR